jgi:hypothetical protein
VHLRISLVQVERHFAIRSGHCYGQKAYSVCIRGAGDIFPSYGGIIWGGLYGHYRLSTPTAKE